MSIFARFKIWRIKRNYRKDGRMAPVLVTRDGIVIDGSNRIEACRQMGVDVPAVILNAVVVPLKPERLKPTVF